MRFLAITVTAQQWNHFPFTVDYADPNTTIKLYLNRALVNYNTSPIGLPRTSTFKLLAGAIGYGAVSQTQRYQMFNGKIDEIAIATRAWTADEVAQLYNSGVGFTWDGTFGSITDHPTLLSGLVSAYRLDKDGNDYLIDNHGNAQGTGAFGAGKIGDSFNPNGVGDYQIPVLIAMRRVSFFFFVRLTDRSSDCYGKAASRCSPSPAYLLFHPAFFCRFS